ncbi:MAG: DUF1007 family protein [Alphaproteobacteria bacterium]
MVCWLLFAHAAIAHPHVWITVKTDILCSNRSIVGIRHKWSFDDMYAALATQGLDKNGDGKYSATELKPLLDTNINSLNEYQYFTFPRVSGKVIDRLPPKDYSIEYKNGSLKLSLTLPLKEPVPLSKIGEFTLMISDPSYYVDFAFAKKSPVHLKSAPAGCKPVIKDPRPDPDELSRLMGLGDAYFADADLAAKIAAQYAKTVIIRCPK